MSAPSTNSAATAAPTAPVVPAAPLPAPQTLVQAAKLAIQLDRAIQLDYYVDTATNKAFLGEDDEAKEKRSSTTSGNDGFIGCYYHPFVLFVRYDRFKCCHNI